ncbi:hypothetical protein [Flavobacterium hibisci]|uniref:hypothetical protein n=1 Tax=Flavobacterium hibisci TaxID=1914462 RepID=UPI001CBF220A|nr:hypothetical protein [Flavobacterium hibisci]MBZ4044505.1 hypothetical protein [Flavobacterium hibisci]
MKNRILLDENKEAANELITYHQLKVSNGHKLISMLDRIGLTLTHVSDWYLEVEQHLSKQFPNASVTFNVEAAGLKSEYEEAEAFYLKNRYNMSFEPFTEDQAENIREQARLYAEGAGQIEAHKHFTSVVESLTRLKELGIRIDIDEAYRLSPVFAGGNRFESLRLVPKELNAVLMKLK